LVIPLSFIMARQSRIHFTINEPCRVPWKGMLPVADDQRHCSSCDRVITDFSKMSDAELMLFFRHSGGNSCGRFAKSQLNRSFTLLPEKTEKAKWWRALALIPLTLFGKNVKAQTDAEKAIQFQSDTTAFVQPNDSANTIAQQTLRANNDSVAIDSIKVAAVIIPDSTYIFIYKPMSVFTSPMLPVIVEVMGICSGPLPESNYDPLYDPWNQIEHSPKKQGEIDQPDPLKNLVDHPQEKPKEPAPALPASNEITGILPEQRKRSWRS
jgi:hypothetical protein